MFFSFTGIYGGVDEETFFEIKKYFDLVEKSPFYSLYPDCHYEKMALMFKNEGYFCKSIGDIDGAMRRAIAETAKPSIINIMIDPMATRKPQDHDWLTRSKL